LRDLPNRKKGEDAGDISTVVWVQVRPAAPTTFFYRTRGDSFPFPKILSPSNIVVSQNLLTMTFKQFSRL